MADKTQLQQLESVAQLKSRLISEIQKRIVGQAETLELVLVALLCRGHGLITGVPGLAKTLLVRSLAEVMELSFSRIQFTPDLMPSDITGTEVIEEDRTTGRRQFKFVPGPVFANLMLADEVNRTPPKTQAALLQAMQEYQVTAMGRTYPLETPFHIFATQNPIEQEGTYPLPEALLDRFMLSIQMDYPALEEERRIVLQDSNNRAPLEKVVGQKALLEAQQLLSQVPVGDSIADYVVRLVRGTRPVGDAPDFVREYVNWGAGPRAAQNLLITAKARALLDGEPSPQRKHVNAVAPAVLRHRLVLNFRAETERLHADEIIAGVIKHIG